MKQVLRVSASKPTCDDDDMRTELDSHADTCVAGRNTLLVSDEGCQVTVHPYSMFPLPRLRQCGSTLRMDNLTPSLEALYFGDRVDVTLLNPNQ